MIASLEYAEAYSNQPLIYPDPTTILPGKPLIVCEGEFDAMLLGQQLPEASVITFGIASTRTDPAVLSRMLSSPRWFIALDADKSGDSAAAKFPASAIRVRPPDARQGLDRSSPGREEPHPLLLGTLPVNVPELGPTRTERRTVVTLWKQRYHEYLKSTPNPNPNRRRPQ